MDLIKLLLVKLKLKPIILYLYGCFKQNQYMQNNDKPRIYFMMIPTYGNLGDQAITEGTLKFLRDWFDKYEIVQVYLEKTYESIPAIKRAYKDKDLILLQGGGNMGTLWQYIENYRRFVIKHLRKCTIISMPVTATFTNNKYGIKELKKSKKVYSKCKELIIFAREIYSYEFLKREFNKQKIYLCPDIVYYLHNQVELSFEDCRKGLLLCFRHDKESINEQQVEEVLRQIFSINKKIRIYDTSVIRNIDAKCRDIEIQAAFNAIGSAKVMITDRMHGMIFSFLTKTPCVVLRALDKKIEGSYKWIENCPYITLIDRMDYETILEGISKIINFEPDYTDYKFSDYFNSMKEIINISIKDNLVEKNEK